MPGERGQCAGGGESFEVVAREVGTAGEVGDIAERPLGGDALAGFGIQSVDAMQAEAHSGGVGRIERGSPVAVLDVGRPYFNAGAARPARVAIPSRNPSVAR